MSSDVTKPGELASFHCYQQGLLLSNKGVHLLSHIFICVACCMRNAEESPGAKNVCTRFFCYQSPALTSVDEDGYSECFVQLKLRFEADVSALPDGVKS